MRFAICHLPFAISHSLLAICYLLSPIGYWLFGHGLSALDPIGSSVRIPTQETSLKRTTLSGTPSLPAKHFWRALIRRPTAGHARRFDNKQQQ
jgi:hypothetical protein